MRKIKTLSIALMVSILLIGLAVPVTAAENKNKEMDVSGNGTGYKIVIPNYVETKKVKTEDENGKAVQVDVIVVERPEINENGEYLVFTIVTTDNYASEANSLPKTLSGKEMSYFHRVFRDQQAPFEIDPNQKLSEFSKDTVFDFNFDVANDDWATIFNSKGLYFMFVDPGTKPSSDNEAAPVTPVAPATATANPTSSKVAVDGKPVAFEAYNIGGSNYFKLRDLAMAVNGTEKQFQVGWDNVNNAIKLDKNEAYTADGSELKVSGKSKKQTAKLSTSKIYIDGKEVQLTAYVIGGYNYFKLRDVAKAMDFNVTWDEKSNSVGIDTENSYIEP